MKHRRLREHLQFLILNLPFLGVMILSIIRKPAAKTITGVDNPTVLTVIDAHLEMLSMVLLSTVWAIGYGWVEGIINVGAALQQLNQSAFLSTYHIFLGATVLAISFSFGLLKGHRMLIHQKRYMFFTALGNVAYSLVVQDFSYFFFVPANDRLGALSWTCGGLGLGCKMLRAPWNPDVLVAVPYWYFLALGLAAVAFFLGYRSVLVNLLVTRQIMKEAGYVEKTSTASTRTTLPLEPAAEEKTPTPVTPNPIPAPPPRLAPVETVKVVDVDRDELVRKLRKRLEQGV